MRVWKFYSNKNQYLEEGLTKNTEGRSFGDAIKSKLEGKKFNKYEDWSRKTDRELEKLLGNESINNIHDTDLASGDDNVEDNFGPGQEKTDVMVLPHQILPGLQVDPDQNNLFDTDMLSSDEDNNSDEPYGNNGFTNRSEMQKELPNRVTEDDAQDFEEQASEENYTWNEFRGYPDDLEELGLEGTFTEYDEHGQKDYSDIIRGEKEDTGDISKIDDMFGKDPDELFPSPYFKENDFDEDDYGYYKQSTIKEYMDNMQQSGSLDNFTNSTYLSLPQFDSGQTGQTIEDNSNNDIKENSSDVDERQISIEEYLESQSQQGNEGSTSSDSKVLNNSTSNNDESIDTLDDDEPKYDSRENGKSRYGESADKDSDRDEFDDELDDDELDDDLDDDELDDELDGNEEQFDEMSKEKNELSNYSENEENHINFNQTKPLDIKGIPFPFGNASSNFNSENNLDSSSISGNIGSGQTGNSSDNNDSNSMDRDNNPSSQNEELGYENADNSLGNSMNNETTSSNDISNQGSLSSSIPNKSNGLDNNQSQNGNNQLGDNTESESNSNLSSSQSSNLDSDTFGQEKDEDNIPSSQNEELGYENANNSLDNSMNNETTSSNDISNQGSLSSSMPNKSNGLDNNQSQNGNNQLGDNTESESNSNLDSSQNSNLDSDTLEAIQDNDEDDNIQDNASTEEKESIQDKKESKKSRRERKQEKLDDKKENRETDNSKLTEDSQEDEDEDDVFSKEKNIDEVGKNQNESSLDNNESENSNSDNDDDESEELTEEEKKSLKDILDDKSKLNNRKKMKLLQKSKKYLNKKMKMEHLHEKKQKPKISEEEERRRAEDFQNNFTDLFEEVPSFEQRSRGDGYAIDTVTLEQVPNSVIKTLIDKFLNQQFCKKDTDLNIRSNNLEERSGFHKWKIKDVVVHLETKQVTKVLTDKVGYSYAEGEQENVPLSFYFDMSGSMSSYTAMLATVAIELMKKKVKVLVGFNERVHVQIDEIDKDIDTEELASILEHIGYSYYSCDNIRNKKIKCKYINDNIDDYLLSRKAEKCVVFSDFDPREEVINLSQDAIVYWFCFEQDFTRRSLSGYQGFVYQVQNINDIAQGLIKVGKKRFEALCYTENPVGVERRRV